MARLKQGSPLRVGGAFVAVLLALGAAEVVLERRAAA